MQQYTFENLYGICFTDMNTGWTAGVGGTVLHTENAGAVGVPDQPPIRHSAFSIRHFPNPSRGIVDFQLSIVDYRRITMKLYDLHGREMGVWLDKELPAGEHNLQFDLSGLPPGIYISQVKAGKEMATLKIIKVH
jgi:hypothetical protein